MMTFYYAPDTCALASHIALEEAGAAYEARLVNFAAAEQTMPEYLTINPKGRVPALVTARGVLTETPALLMFVAQSHPGARLAPLDDAFELAAVQASTATSARRCTSPMRIGCAATAGPTTRRPSKR
jgi:glutathione S-transferase